MLYTYTLDKYSYKKSQEKINKELKGEFEFSKVKC